MATYEPKDYSGLVGMQGFSEDLMETHVGLYKAYVEHTNKALDLLSVSDLDAYAKAEVRRRLGWEFNGMRLHEIFFDALTDGGDGADTDTDLQKDLERDFGSFQDWKADFQEVAGARGIGWAVLTYDAKADRLHNAWINEHDVGFLAGTQPILLLDVFEHAFIRDFGTDKGAYMDAYFGNVDWTVPEKRFSQLQDVPLVEATL